MVTDTDFLVVYGTLRPAFNNPFAHFLREHSQYVAEGTFRGRLFDIGTYPGAIYEPERSENVCGSLYDLGLNKALIIQKLDEYEGISPEFQQPHEYARTIIPVNCSDALRYCWVYLYNWPLSKARQIDTGDYVHYVEK